MKSIIFNNAIQNRNKIRFLYKYKEVIIDPYFIELRNDGNKMLFGKVSSSNEFKSFEYKNIVNIKVLEKSKFAHSIFI